MTEVQEKEIVVGSVELATPRIGCFSYHGGALARPLFAVVTTLFVAGVAILTYRIDRVVVASGEFKDATGRIVIQSEAGGYVDTVSARLNDVIELGAPILELDKKRSLLNIEQVEETMERLKRQISDINVLLDSTNHDKLRVPDKLDFQLSGNVTTAKYVSESELLRARIQVEAVKVLQSEKRLERYKALHGLGLTTTQELEQELFAHSLINSGLELTIADLRNQWQHSIVVLEEQLIDSRRKLTDFQSELDRLRVRSPTTGQLIYIISVAPGTYIPAGAKIAELVTDSPIRIEMNLTPEVIGFIRTGQSVRVEVNGLPSSQWGTLTATVESISRDRTSNSERGAGFLVTAILDRDTLVSNAGQVMPLLRGMVVQARIVTGRLPVFDLLIEQSGLSF